MSKRRRNQTKEILKKIKQNASVKDFKDPYGLEKVEEEKAKTQLSCYIDAEVIDRLDETIGELQRLVGQGSQLQFNRTTIVEAALKLALTECESQLNRKEKPVLVTLVSEEAGQGKG